MPSFYGEPGDCVQNCTILPTLRFFAPWQPWHGFGQIRPQLIVDHRFPLTGAAELKPEGDKKASTPQEG